MTLPFSDSHFVCVLSVIFKCSLVIVDNIFAGVAELSWIYLELAVEGNVKAKDSLKSAWWSQHLYCLGVFPS